MMIRADDAFAFVVDELSRLRTPTDPFSANSVRQSGCDIWIPNTVWRFWRQHDRTLSSELSELSEAQLVPFYDAAWDLARIGVLRPGEVVPRGMSMARGFHGDGYSLTVFGREWLRDAGSRPIIDPSRLSEVLQAFRARFGDGYAQRATEAVRTYRTGNYLAACVMAGAAAESVLLAAAVAKDGNEGKVLGIYATNGGRVRVTRHLLGGVAPGTAAQFNTALQVLHYWRDDAGHGTMTTISETEAHASLTQLLRLAQFASDHWAQLTS